MDGLKFDGDALFLDRADINTDEIIPARYLTESTKEALKPHCLEDLALADFDPGRDIEGAAAIVARGNFGCGSSREHAPWALEANGIRMVIAPSFARIFRQNMFNCGLMAVELPEATVDEIFRRFGKDKTSVEADLERNVLSFRSAEDELELPFSLSPFDRDLVIAGGWVAYANAKY